MLGPLGICLILVVYPYYVVACSSNISQHAPFQDEEVKYNIGLFDLHPNNAYDVVVYVAKSGISGST
jgi:hypothetical protein